MTNPEMSRSGGWLLPVVLLVGALASMILIGGGLLVLWGDKSTIFDHPLLKTPPTGTSTGTPSTGPTTPASAVPHPMYPTPESAGTHELFQDDHADRGPQVDLNEPRPPNLPNPSYHAHCEQDPGGLVCGPKLSSAPLVGWSVGQSSNLVVARKVRFGEVHQTILVEQAAKALKRILEFDGHDQVERGWFFDPSGVMCSARDRTGANDLDGCGRMQMTWDTKGRASRAACRQWNGKPMKDTRGVAAVGFERDKSGFVVEERYFDAKGASVARYDGVFRLSIERDAAGRKVSEKGFDDKNAPVVSAKTGCHGLQWVRDERGLLVERRCLGIDGKLARDSAEVAVERYALNDNGCVVGERYLDPAEAAATAFNGVHALTRRVTALCETTEKRCLNEQGGLVSCGPQEPMMYTYVLDALGRVETTTHLGENGEPGRDPEFGVYELRYVLDDAGLIVEQTCFDETSSATPCGSTGFHGRATKYDEAGREVEARFFDTARAPTTNQGTFIRAFSYDAYDHLIETRNLDQRGGLVDSMGNSIGRYLYDEGHRLFGVLLYDADSKPATYTGCFAGLTCPSRPWHAVRVVRSDKGRATKNMFFDRDRNLVFTSDCDSAQCWL